MGPTSPRGAAIRGVAAAEEKTDQHGRQKADRRTGEPLWTVQVMALDDNGWEMLKLTVPCAPPPSSRSARAMSTA